jgi:hypothetical protein
MMPIVIPTRGRTHTQLTFKSLLPELIKRTTLVCPEKEYAMLSNMRSDWKVVIQPDPTWTISKKRKWIMEEWGRQGFTKIIMLDDDLRFATRISLDDWHLKEIVGEELAKEFHLLEDKLGPEYPHVGFGPRQGNQTLKEVGWKTPGKMCYSLGYYLPVVLKECELGRIETREDMDVTLQLLLKGYPNAIWTTTVNDQRKYDAPGGATNERTVESSNADARRLAELHPGYVSTVERAYKASVPRIEVVIQWKKALEDGIKLRNGLNPA